MDLTLFLIIIQNSATWYFFKIHTTRALQERDLHYSIIMYYSDYFRDYSFLNFYLYSSV